MDSPAALSRELILDKAIILAQQSSWQSMSLIELASSLDCSLVEIKTFFRSKDDIAESLFDRADDAMLSLAGSNQLQDKSSDEKLIEIIMTWFLALASIKSIVREVMAYKFEPGHFHLQAHGITRVSRTVQWFLTVANRQYTGISRIADEVAVTSAYLASFSRFLTDDSAQHQKTRQRLTRFIRNIRKGHQALASIHNTAPPNDN